MHVSYNSNGNGAPSDPPSANESFIYNINDMSRYVLNNYPIYCISITCFFSKKPQQEHFEQSIIANTTTAVSECLCK